jgi:hypothetical protein
MTVDGHAGVPINRHVPAVVPANGSANGWRAGFRQTLQTLRDQLLLTRRASEPRPS